MADINVYDEYLREGERVDDLQCKGYHILQHPGMFCFGMDAVLLADFATGSPKSKVIDLGTGTGIIPILMYARNKGQHFTGLEIQDRSADMAHRSIMMNGLEEHISIIQGDIKEAHLNFKGGSFDVVTSNPPYITHNHGLENPDEPKNIARHEILVNLSELVASAAYLLRQGGTFAIIHKPFRLNEIFSTLTASKLEPKRMRLIQPYIDKEPTMVLVEAVKGGRPMLKIEPTLVVYNRDGSYTEEVILRYNKH